MESFSFSEIKKRSLAAKLCTVLCDTVSDKTTLLERYTIFVTFAPTADDTSRTTLPKELRLALINNKKYFFKGGFILQMTSSIPVPPDYLFQAALLTLLSLDQTDRVPTPTD